MPIDFETHRKKIKNTNSDLQKRAKNAPQSLSIDDIAELLEDDCKINGTVFHQDKQDKYDAIRAAVLEYVEQHKSATKPLQMNEDAPSRDNMYAHIHLYTINPAGTQVDRILPLIEATKLADEFTVSPGDDDGVTMEFIWTVMNIWTEN